MKTDIRLKQDVVEELNWDPRVRDAAIDVAVKSGVVILSGQVPNYGVKLSAEEAVRHIRDVKGVVEEITVQLPASSKRTDADITHAVVNALKWNDLVPDKDTKTEVKNGWLTLSGSVSWQFQKDTAGNLVRDITGLKGISNNIEINPRIHAQVQESNIKKALERSADIEPSRIVVEIRGNRVILRGKARSWNERNEAERAAWCSPGVTEVDDELVIA